MSQIASLAAGVVVDARMSSKSSRLRVSLSRSSPHRGRRARVAVAATPNDALRRSQAMEAMASCVTSSDLGVGEKYAGKVRDTYVSGDTMIAVTTDRQSAFDRHLAFIPFKGAVLNQTSQWWFRQTADIVPNAVLATPDPNVTVMRRCEVFPIEFVVRGYLTGSTSTSLWTHYKKGGRNYCGNELADGMVKNQKLPMNIVTPTTKEKEHDRPISLEDIVKEGWMKQEDLDYCVAKTLEVFEYAQGIAATRGLILVDTKYEFGRDSDGTIRLIDEINTPDSSRYWLNDSYAERHAAGKEPDMIDKEFLRLWFAERCDPYKDEVLPEAPADLVAELSSRYVKLYEMITGETFEVPPTSVDVNERMRNSLKGVL